MKAALLAAGKGKRLLPATEARPKPLLPIAGSTLFEYNLLAIRNELPIYTVVSYKKDLFSKLSDKYGFFLIDQGIPLGTGHAVLRLEDFIKDDFLLIYSDVYVPPETKDLLISSADRYDHVVAVSPVDRPWEFGVVDLKDGLLNKIVEKPNQGEEPSNLVIAGAFYLSQTIFDHLKDVKVSPRGEIELTDALTLAARRGEKVGLVEISPWVDAGRPSDFLKAQRLLFRDVIIGNRPKPKGFELEDNILISRKAELSDSEVSGPLAIGKCEVMNSKLYPYIYLEDGSRVASSKMENSIAMRGSIINLSNIKDSLITDSSIISESKLVKVVTASSVRIHGCSITDEKVWKDRTCFT